MFTNFIYFIIVLLIFSTYPPPVAALDMSPWESLACFLALFVILICFGKLFFSRIERRMMSEKRTITEKKMNRTVSRLSVIALFFIGIDIYFFHITTLLLSFPPFSSIPTLKAAFCIVTMMAYLSIIWTGSHRIRQHLYMNEESVKSHILQQFSFATPLILPWFIMSGISDLITLLPFETIKRFFFSPLGEIIYFSVLIVTIAITGPFLVQKMWRCRSLPDSPQRRRITHLCDRAKLDCADILSWPIFGGMAMTAGIMGLVRRFRYILVTPAMLRMLTPEELDAVISHEIGHAKKKHLPLYLLFFLGYIIFIGAIFDPIAQAVYYIQPMPFFSDMTATNQSTVLSLTISLFMVLVFIIYFRFLFGYFMRNFERQADGYVYQLMDNAEPLISTFTKISASGGQDPDKPNWHHFSIRERVQYLKKCENDRTHIHRHNTKVKRSIVIYLMGMVFFLLLFTYRIVYNKDYGYPYYLTEDMVLSRLNETPDDPELLKLMGDVYYHSEKFEKAYMAYEKALQSDPGNTEIMNNLAWLLATCANERVRDPKRALELIQKAAMLSSTPEVLDTLAESYYVNGNLDEAVSVGKKALKAARENRAYYEAQLNKFTQALRERERLTLPMH